MPTSNASSSKPEPRSIWQRSNLLRFFGWLCSWRALRLMLLAGVWIFTGAMLLYGIVNWRGRRAWTEYRNQLEARGEQLDLSAFVPKPVPDEQNFASTPFVQSWFDRSRAGESAQAWRTTDSYARLGHRVGPGGKNRPSETRQLIDLAGWQMALAAARTNVPVAGQRFESGRLDTAARAQAAPAVLEALSSFENALTELREASQRPACRYPVVYDMENPWGILLPHLSSVKAVCNRLELKACAELAAGRSDQALRDVKLACYLMDSLADEPFLIAYLVRLASQPLVIQPIWEGLAEHRWSEAQLLELQRYLLQLDFLTDLKRPLATERAAGILTADLVRKKGLGLLVALTSGAPIPDRSLANFIGLFVPSGWYYREQLNYCRLFDQGMAGAVQTQPRRVFPRQIEANARVTADAVGNHQHKPFHDVLQHRVLASLLLPALEKVPTKAAMAQVAADQAALACALERHRLATGQFPDKLETLIPRFLNALPIDPCNGEPYRYQRNPDGQFILYSVGWNETDDGGFPGRSLFDEKQGDWVWEYARP